VLLLLQEEAVKGYWTCQRRSNGSRCGHLNRNAFRLCRACGKRRPPRKRPAHMKALENDYAFYVALNGGDFCGICKKPRQGRRLDRDHCHKTGTPRGLCCHSCNRTLGPHVDIPWLENAIAYLRRTAV
jgi:hypothetical protein